MLRAPAAEDQGRVQALRPPRRRGPCPTRSPTTSVRPSPRRSRAVRSSRGSGLPDDLRASGRSPPPPRRGSLPCRARVRRAAGRWGRGRWRGSPRRGGRRATALAQVVVDELLGPPDHHDLGARREVGAVQDLAARRRSRVAAARRCRSRTRSGPVRVSASTCCIAPPTVTTSRGRPGCRSSTGGPRSPRSRRAGCWSRTPRCLPASRTPRRPRRHRGRLLADPDGAVEIEDELVVARRRGRSTARR